MDLPGFDRIVFADTEFTPVVGGHSIPICYCAHELVSGERVQLWYDELGPEPPFPTDERTLYVAHSAQAEIGFHLVAWPSSPAPARVFDTLVEFRNLTNVTLPKSYRKPNGEEGRQRARLTDALDYFHIRDIHGYTITEKTEMQNIAIRGAPFTDQERDALLRYCAADVACLAPLFERLLVHTRAKRRAPGAPPRGFVQALNRGRYVSAVAHMEHTGVPIDEPTFEWLKEHRLEVRTHLIEQGDRGYNVFDGTNIHQGRFRKYLAEQHLLNVWPRTDKTGKLSTDADEMKELARAHPQLENLRQLLLLRSALQNFKLAVGPDGRNRAHLWPFTAATGRNAPSSGEFIFGPSTWWRGLIKPAEGMALAYIDYNAQELGIAAALSKDPELLKAVESGDPYLAFAARAELVPDGATKDTHGNERGICKVALLGMNYGLGVRSLAAGTGLSPIHAARLHQQMQRTYEVFGRWSQRQIDTGLLRGEITTRCGWRAGVVEGTKVTTLKNFPAQAHGAAMLRAACCLIVEAGITLCAPIHDAVLVEAPADEIDAVVERTRRLMGRASRELLGGFEVGTDAEIVRYPGRYMEGRGRRIWDLMMAFKEQVR